MAAEASEESTTTAAGEEQKADGLVQRMQRLPLPGVGMPAAMPTGVPGRVLWWGGLAALAAFDIVEWPVAVVVGAGEWIAEQYAKTAAQHPRAESRSPAPPTPPPPNG